jgi:hypothetical protein
MLKGVIHHQGGTLISRNWILLNNQSTVDVFCNGCLLQNIQEVNKTMNIKCNAGVTRTSWVGDLSGYGQVWYNKVGIANILSLFKVEDKYCITYDSAQEKQFIVQKDDGEKRCFRKSANGLFYLGAKETSGTVLVTTVEVNKSRYMNRDYTQVTLARKLQNIIGRPLARAFLKIVEHNHLMLDCLIVCKDVL